MQKQGSSILAAVPIWSEFLQKALPHMQNETFTQPDAVNEAKPILAGTPFPDGTAHSILYYVDKSDPTGPIPTNPEADPQFKNWEADTQDWVSKNEVLPVTQPGAQTQPSSTPTQGNTP